MVRGSCNSSCSKIPRQFIVLPNSEPECSGTDIRLVNGDTKYDGTVQICYNGVWGAVCGSNWDNTDANVTCRQLGYSPLSKHRETCCKLNF